MNFTSDIDIDFADRNKILNLISCVPAAIRKDGVIKKHVTGVYVTDVPYDPVHDVCSLHYEDAESRGYVKLDLLNVSVYSHVRDEEHLVSLMREPNWKRLEEREFVSKLVHLNSQYSNLSRLPEKIDSIPRLAMFLAMIRPGKKHLLGKPWAEVSKTIWDKTQDGFQFKKSHSLAYSHLVVVHMNLLEEQECQPTT